MSQEEALSSDVNYILAGYRGHVWLLKTMWGSDDDSKRKKKQGVSAGELKDFARTHNKLLQKGRIKLDRPKRAEPKREST